MKSARPLALAAGILIATALLSGCSAVNAVVKAQSRAVACAQIAPQLRAVGTGLSNEASKAPTDLKSAATISTDAYNFDVATKKIKNASVKKSAGKAAMALNKFSQDLSTMANLGQTPQDESNLQSDITPLQTTFGALETACKP